MKHGVQWDSKNQIWLSEASQVQVRNAQSRVFDTTDRVAMLKAVVSTLQDLGFQIEVLDETLGLVSAKQFLPLTTKAEDRNATYMLYDEESLVVFQKSFNTWEPFFRRSDLVRLTVSVRKRNQQQLIVRAAAQHFLRPVENPEPYQRFYAALEQTLFAERIEGSGS
jgi:activator of HSP90 ATPase